MKYFILILICLVFSYGVYSFFDIPFASSVDSEYTIKVNNGK